MALERMTILEAEGVSVTEARPSAPIFAYGTLQGEGMQVSTGNQALLLGRFVTRGVALGMGDKYPCADITFDMSDTAYGDGVELCDISQEALGRVDEYEGVNDGYYQRRMIFASPERSHNLFVPMWIYVRGEKLKSE